MRIVRQEDICHPAHGELGEVIYEMIGEPEEIGGARGHSLAHVAIPPGCRSPAHYHRVAEETYYILKGEADLVIDGERHRVTQGIACLIMPGETHQIITAGAADLHFLAISAPPWVPTDTYSPDSK